MRYKTACTCAMHTHEYISEKSNTLIIRTYITSPPHLKTKFVTTYRIIIFKVHKSIVNILGLTSVFVNVHKRLVVYELVEDNI